MFGSTASSHVRYSRVLVNQSQSCAAQTYIPIKRLYALLPCNTTSRSLQPCHRHHREISTFYQHSTVFLMDWSTIEHVKSTEFSHQIAASPLNVPNRSTQKSRKYTSADILVQDYGRIVSDSLASITTIPSLVSRRGTTYRTTHFERYRVSIYLTQKPQPVGIS